MKLAIIGDYDSSFRPHIATNEAIEHSLKSLQAELAIDWISTNVIEENFERITEAYDSFWIAPGSPYKSMAGALRVIEYARLNNIPTLGTCGGFQHMVIEFARNVVGIKAAAHAEYDPYASELIVNPLSCSLDGKILEIKLIGSKSIVHQLFSSRLIKEKYYCNFGLNPKYQSIINDNGFTVVGTDVNNAARILELKDHPFFIATLFVPQDNSSFEKPHKLITGFIKHVLAGR